MLREMGHEVVILNSTYKRDMFNCFNDNGFRCIEHKGLMGSIMHYSGGPNLFSRTFLTNLFNINATKNRIIEVISQENPDLVIVNSIVLAWLSIILRKLEIKSICFIRETPIKGIFTNITKVFLRKFSVLAFISEYDKDFYKLNNTKCIVIKDTIKFDESLLKITKRQACEKLKVSSKNFNILFLGGTSELKGWKTVEKCIDMVENMEVKFVVAGYSDEAKKINNKKVQYIGVVENIQYMYKACDLVILPSKEPHQLMPIFEAGFFMVPVITSDFKQIRENITNGETGLTIQPNSPQQLCSAINKIFTDKELRGKLINNNFKKALEHEYTITRNIFEKEINEILKKV